jgi:predicted nucleic acid-binding protein
VRINQITTRRLKKMLYIALDEGTNSATAIANDSDKDDLHITGEMVFETSAQLCMVDVCGETEKE